jgi:hypothetical protein
VSSLRLVHRQDRRDAEHPQADAGAGNESDPQLVADASDRGYLYLIPL